MLKNNKSVLKYIFGKGSFSNLNNLLEKRRATKNSFVVFIIDEYFWQSSNIKVEVKELDEIVFVKTGGKNRRNILIVLQRVLGISYTLCNCWYRRG